MQSMRNIVVFAITVGAVSTLAESRPAMAQPLVWTDPEPLSNRPPAERVALGSPPEGGVGFRKAPLGPLSKST